MGDLMPERMPKRVEGMETPDEPAAGNEPGGHIVSDAQRRALAPILGKNNGKGTSTDLQALGYTVDSIGRYHENGNLGVVESSDELHQYMASKKDRIAQNAIQATKSRLGRVAVKNGFGS